MFAPGCRSKGNDELFARMTGAEAWLAGVIWADGCLVEENRARGGRHILIRSVDQDLALQAAVLAGVDAKRRQDKRPDRKPNYTVRIGNPLVVERLVARGLTPRKSHTATFPRLPKRAVAPFVRGFFDGDGTVKFDRPNRLVSGFDGSLPMMESLQDILRSVYIAPRKIQRNSSIWRLRYNHSDSVILAAFMYADGGPCLARKRERFLSIV